MKLLHAAFAAAIVFLSGCHTVDTREGTVTKIEWRVNLVRTGQARVIETFTGDSQAKAWAACIAKLNDLTPNAYDCQALRFHAVVEADPVPPPTCTTPQPPDETRTQACPSGTTGTWSQTRVYAAAPYPTCWVAGEWLPTAPPAGACKPPAPAGMPTPDNTGPTTENLEQRGAFTVSTDGAVVENFHATGTVKITASNVTLRNFKVTTSSDNCIRAEDGVRNVVLEDGECDGAKSSGITGEGFTARRLHVHNMGSDAFHLNDVGYVSIEASYITQLGYNASSHADGVQVSSGTNVSITGNNFDMPGEDPKYNNSQIFMIKPDAGPIKGLRIEGNWLNGGGYSVNMAGESSDVHIRNNRFGREFNYGPWKLSGNPELCGNVWDDTGGNINQDGNAPCEETAQDGEKR